MYLDGDVDRTEYQARRAMLTEQLAALPTDDDRTDEAGQRLAAFLADVSAAWMVATPEERNQLARQLFRQVVVTNRAAVAVVPRPDLRPFFHLVAVNPPDEVAYGGSDGDPLREIDAVAPPLVPLLYPDLMLRADQRRGVGRYAPGAKLPCIPREFWPELVERAQCESLRIISRELGVSHETVRAVLRSVKS